MSGLYGSILDTVGRTPLVALSRLCRHLPGLIMAKVESLNPCGSVKDRVGVAMVDDAEKRGLLKPGATLIEPTTGNTGVALAFVAAARGYRLIVTIPERMSPERMALLQYLGAQVISTPGSLMRAAVEKAEALHREIPGSVILGQFQNSANPEVHRRTTALEIWDDCDGKVDVFVAGVGTGGTITGVGEVLKSKNPRVKVVAVEPARAAVLSGQEPGNHLIQGIGAGFVPPVLNRFILDEICPVSEEESIFTARRLAREEGIVAGISSGAALAAALKIAERPESDRKRIVVILPDTGERYFSTPLLADLPKG